MKTVILSFFLLSLGFADMAVAQESPFHFFIEPGFGFSQNLNPRIGKAEYWQTENGLKLDLSAGISYKQTGICFTVNNEKNDMTINPAQSRASFSNTLSSKNYPQKWQSTGFYTGFCWEAGKGALRIRSKIQGGILSMRFPEVETVFNYSGGTDQHLYSEATATGLGGIANIALGYSLSKQLLVSTFCELSSARLYFAVAENYRHYDKTTFTYTSELRISSFEKSANSATFGLRLAYSIPL